MAKIKPGDHVRVRTTDGQWLPRRAVSGVQMGKEFYVVLVARDEEWQAANNAGEKPEGFPWPADAVEIVVDDRD